MTGCSLSTLSPLSASAFTGSRALWRLREGDDGVMSLCGDAFVDMSQGSSRLLVAMSVYVRCVNAQVVHSLSVGLFYDSLQTHHNGPFTVRVSVGLFYDSLQTHHNGPFTVSWSLL